MHFKRKENYFQNCFWDFQEFEKRTNQLKEEGVKCRKDHGKKEDGEGKVRKEESRREDGGGKGKRQEGKREDIKKEMEREKVIEMSVCEENGDFCVVSKGYMSIYTVNGVLIATVYRKVDKIAKFQTCLIIQVYSFNNTKGLILAYLYRTVTVMKMITFYQVIQTVE